LAADCRGFIVAVMGFGGMFDENCINFMIEIEIKGFF